MSDKLLEKADTDIDKLINNVSTAFKVDSYKILDQYNVQNSTTDTSNILLAGISNDNDYAINYVSID